MSDRVTFKTAQWITQAQKISGETSLC